MMRGLEHAVFFRSLNYLRVSHAYALRYNWIYPLAIGLIVSALIVRPDTAADLFAKDSLIVSFVPVLSILAPFYIAALAAVATFTGSNFVDKSFEMSQPVLLEVLGAGGDWEFIDVTPRHFLSLLFGYCTTISLLLLCVSIFAPFVLAGVKAVASDWAGLCLGLIVFAFLVLLAQLLVNTLLGVYYLSDRLHRG